MPTQKSQLPRWHALSVDETFALLESDAAGLSNQQARDRRKRYGPNLLPPPQRHGPLVRFLLQFHNVLIYVLLGASVVTALLGHWIDSFVILGVVVVNALIGFIQEGKAEKALESIRGMLAPMASVLRDGRRQTLRAEDLVPGDIVLLQAGDKVPADLRLTWVKELRIEEAMLTGESVPAQKGTQDAQIQAPVGDRTGMAYSGTLVTYGQGTGVVVSTGRSTEIGRISEMLAGVQTLTTPLLRDIAHFARRLTVLVLALAAGTFAFGVLVRDYSAGDMFLAAVGLIVAAIPEGLPAIITITLAIGVQRMARRHAIIRRLPAVETLGAVTVICSDKTGTLTRNEMTVQAVVTAGGEYAVSGVGYDPHGEVTPQGDAGAARDPVLEMLARGAVLCNDAVLEEKEGHWTIQGDPTEGALLTLGRKLGLDPDFENSDRPRTDIIPFESEHRFMATLHHDHEGNGFIFVKGAPERILQMCTLQRAGGEDLPIEPSLWHDGIARFAAKGQRVLAVGFKGVESGKRDLRFDDVETGVTLLGLVGISDPPRREATESVADCHSAGIRVKMITGDHGETARAIGAQMGIGLKNGVRTGPELEAASDAQLREWVAEIDIFARSSPEHKLRLVKALQENGEVVAMTGDGVNDAPALKRANVGVAMGIKGTEVAKEASEMVLTDDNFASITHAVEEGRTVYDNIKKAILFILPTNGAEAFIILAAIALGRTLPITPVQILWVNMITAVTLALALAFEPAEADVMKRPPRDPKEPILGGFILWRIVYVSLILVAGTFGLFLWQRGIGASIETARTVAVNTLVLFEAFYLLNSRYLHRSTLSAQGLMGNRYVLAAIALVLVFQILFTYAPPMQTLFGTAAIDAATWGWIVLTTFSVFVLVELEKWVYRLFSEKKKTSSNADKIG